MKSKNLILIPCSLNKRTGGEEKYDNDQRLCNGLLLPDSASELLKKTRNKVRKWLETSKDKIFNVPLSELPQNKETIKYGKDFGGSVRAQYLPAAIRYDGRLFQTLLQGNNEQPPISPLMDANHHILIVSGLYGLLLPEEYIQLYSCPLDRKLESFHLWTQDDNLTNVLIAYIRRHHIERVFDLLCIADYRSALDWSVINEVLVKNKVLHCHGSATVGADLLIPVGQLLRDHLLPATEADIQSICQADFINVDSQQLKLRADIKSPFRLEEPQELQKQLDLRDRCDKVDRARVGIIRYLQKVAGKFDHIFVGQRVEQCRKSRIIEKSEADLMIQISRIRSGVVYDDKQLSEQEWQSFCDKVKKLSDHAKSRDLKIPQLEIIP